MNGNGEMKTPDITPAQIVALIQPFVTATIGLFVAFGVEMTNIQQTAVIGFTGALAALISTGLFIADAIIRNGRSRAMLYPPKPTNTESVGG